MRIVDNTDEYLRRLLTARLGTDPASIVPQAYLRRDLGVDSLGLVSLIVEIEDDLGLDIPDEDAVQLRTVKQLMDYVAFAAAAQQMQRERQVMPRYKKAVGHR